MTKDRQKEFIEEVCAGLREHALKQLPRIPENWDGHELRQWLSDTLRERWVMKLSRSQMRSYNNDRIVENL